MQFDNFLNVFFRCLFISGLFLCSLAATSPHIEEGIEDHKKGKQHFKFLDGFVNGFAKVLKEIIKKPQGTQIKVIPTEVLAIIGTFLDSYEQKELRLISKEFKTVFGDEYAQSVDLSAKTVAENRVSRFKERFYRIYRRNPTEEETKGFRLEKARSSESVGQIREEDFKKYFFPRLWKMKELKRINFSNQRFLTDELLDQFLSYLGRPIEEIALQSCVQIKIPFKVLSYYGKELREFSISEYDSDDFYKNVTKENFPKLNSIGKNPFLSNSQIQHLIQQNLHLQIKKLTIQSVDPDPLNFRGKIEETLFLRAGEFVNVEDLTLDIAAFPKKIFHLKHLLPLKKLKSLEIKGFTGYSNNADLDNYITPFLEANPNLKKISMIPMVSSCPRFLTWCEKNIGKLKTFDFSLESGMEETYQKLVTILKKGKELTTLHAMTYFNPDEAAFKKVEDVLGICRKKSKEAARFRVSA